MEYEITPRCCEVWDEIKGAFKWFSPVDDSSVRLMPYIQADGPDKWRVQFCPSCGKTRRGVIEAAQ